MNIKLTNNKNFEINKQFYQTAKKILKKIKKNLIPLNIFIKKKNNTSIIIADDTNQSQGSYKFRGASSEIINLKKKKIKTISLGSTGNFGLSMSHLCKKNKIICNIFVSRHTNINKINKLKKNNAILHTNNKNYDDAKMNAKKLIQENSLSLEDSTKIIEDLYYNESYSSQIQLESPKKIKGEFDFKEKKYLFKIKKNTSIPKHFNETSYLSA